jgi:cytochrome c oxidase cbb3-type subunit IV
MLRYIKHNLSEIAGIEIFPIISLLIFVAFFAIVIWRTMRIKKAEIAEMSNIPLEDDEKYLDNNTNNR